jgi:hypothetical protein
MGHPAISLTWLTNLKEPIMSKEDTPENAPARKDQSAKGPAAQQGSMSDKGGSASGSSQSGVAPKGGSK